MSDDLTEKIVKELNALRRDVEELQSQEGGEAAPPEPETGNPIGLLLALTYTTS